MMRRKLKRVAALLALSIAALCLMPAFACRTKPEEATTGTSIPCCRFK